MKKEQEPERTEAVNTNLEGLKFLYWDDYEDYLDEE